jgi:hypothetical protein
LRIRLKVPYDSVIAVNSPQMVPPFPGCLGIRLFLVDAPKSYDSYNRNYKLVTITLVILPNPPNNDKLVEIFDLEVYVCRSFA